MGRWEPASVQNQELALAPDPEPPVPGLSVEGRLGEKVKGPSWKRGSAHEDRPRPAYPVEGLSHLPQEVLGDLDTLVHGQVEVGVGEVLLDPAGKLPALVRPGKPLMVGEGQREDVRPPGVQGTPALPPL